MAESEAPLDLAHREKLPEALRVLLEEYPREAWEANPNYSGLIRFWLDRHMMFRNLLAQMEQDTQGILDKAEAPRNYAARLSRYGGAFVNELHGHHHIEDEHYFPVLTSLDTRISRGFDILDQDHHALDGLLASFVSRANGVLQNLEKPVFHDRCGEMLAEIESFRPMLMRHLEDEEELVVPVLLKYAPAGLA